MCRPCSGVSGEVKGGHCGWNLKGEGENRGR